jgi:histone H3/H4
MEQHGGNVPYSAAAAAAAALPSSSNSKFAIGRNLSFAGAAEQFQQFQSHEAGGGGGGGGTRQGTANSTRIGTAASGTSMNMGMMGFGAAPFAPQSQSQVLGGARRGLLQSSGGAFGNNNNNNNNGLDMAQQAAVGQIMSDIDSKVFGLKEIFRKGNILEDRKRGAELIGALARGYLCRQRLAKFRRGMREWRWVRCRPVTYLLDILLSNHSKRDAGFNLLRTNRTMKTLNNFFGKWAGVCRQNAPVRRAVKQAAEHKIEDKRMELLRKVFKGLFAVSVGELSTRNANAVRRKLLDEIRLELSEKYKMRSGIVISSSLAEGASGGSPSRKTVRTPGGGSTVVSPKAGAAPGAPAPPLLLGVVPEFEVQKILHHRVLLQFMEKQRLLTMRFCYKALHQTVGCC